MFTGWLAPQQALTRSEIRHGMRMMIWDGVFAQSMSSLTMGAFMIGFALSLGASNTVVGIISALGPLAVLLQAPTVYLIQRYPFRKTIVVWTALFSRLMWLLIALLPFVVPAVLRIPLLVAALLVHFSLGNICGCAFSSWIRDLIPEKRLGAFFSRRMALATAASAALSLTGGAVVDLFHSNAFSLGGDMTFAYALLFAVSVIFGMTSIGCLLRAPEPVMPVESGKRFRDALGQPMRDARFRQLLIFMGCWNFAINFASPFFAVYMLNRLGLSMSWVVGFGVVSQLVNVRFFSFWGRLADRFSNKSVLLFTAPLFLFTFLIWPFTTMPNQHMLTIPLLFVIHSLAGIATAGVNLCTGNLALKSAPYGKAGAYLAVNALISGAAAMSAPILAGMLGDALANREIALALHLGGQAELLIPALSLRGLDFLFLVAFVLGLYAMHRLLAVVEQGDIEEKELRQAFFAEMLRVARQVSTVAGVRHILFAPFFIVREIGRASQPPDLPED